MKRMNIIRLAAAGALACAPLASNAVMGEIDAYAGASVGWYGLEDDVEDEEFDDDNSAFRIYAGGRFHEYFGVEAGYANFGELEGEDDAADADFQADGFEIAALGYLPIGQFSPFIKVGQLFWESETNVGPVSADDDGNDFFFGVGAQYDVNEAFAVRLEANRYEMAEADVDALWASAQLNF